MKEKESSKKSKKACLNFRNCCCSCLILIAVIILGAMVFMNALGFWHIPGIDQLVWRGGPKPTREMDVEGRKIEPEDFLSSKFGLDIVKRTATATFSEEETSLFLNYYLKSKPEEKDSFSPASGQVIFLGEEAEAFIRLETPETALTINFITNKDGDNFYLVPRKIKIGKLNLPRFLAEILIERFSKNLDISKFGILDLEIKEEEAEVTVDPMMVKQMMKKEEK